MDIEALLISTDQHVTSMLRTVLQELGVRVQCEIKIFAAAKQISARSFPLVVADCGETGDLRLLSKAMRSSQHNSKSYLVAVVTGSHGASIAFHVGADLVLSRPILVTQARNTLRIACTRTKISPQASRPNASKQIVAADELSNTSSSCGLRELNASDQDFVGTPARTAGPSPETHETGARPEYLPPNLVNPQTRTAHTAGSSFLSRLPDGLASPATGGLDASSKCCNSEPQEVLSQAEANPHDPNIAKTRTHLPLPAAEPLTPVPAREPRLVTREAERTANGRPRYWRIVIGTTAGSVLLGGLILAAKYGHSGLLSNLTVRRMVVSNKFHDYAQGVLVLARANHLSPTNGTGGPAHAIPSRDSSSFVNIPADVAARLLVKQVQPTYPLPAQQKHANRVVVLRISVNEDGVVQDAEVVGVDGALANAALNAVKQWRYRPYLVNGKPAAMRTTATILFQLPPKKPSPNGQ